MRHGDNEWAAKHLYSLSREAKTSHAPSGNANYRSAMEECVSALAFAGEELAHVPQVEGFYAKYGRRRDSKRSTSQATSLATCYDKITNTAAPHSECARTPRPPFSTQSKS